MQDTELAPNPLNTPVLFVVFNRPDVTAKVFDAIRQARPKKLYIAADAPRKSLQGEATLCARVRAIATNIDWCCEVHTLFQDNNRGCKLAMSSAISWFFNHEEEGIILEDDCLPHQDFFRYCSDLLERYRADQKVFVITGVNFQNGRTRGDASYYFSKYPHCWGWATWRRAWKYYLGDLGLWPNWKKSLEFVSVVPNRRERRYWTEIFDQCYEGSIDSWAYPWVLSVWIQRGLTATPNVNLISNIGFGRDATHTTDVGNKLAARPTYSLDVITHTKTVTLHRIADSYTFNYMHGSELLDRLRMFLRAPYRIFLVLWRKII
jgi:hypothetical protein